MKKKKVNRSKNTSQVLKDYKKMDWKTYGVCALIAFGTAAIGSQFTDTGSWYESIKPSLTPPNYVFPIVWTILFYLISVAMYYSWKDSNNKQKKTIVLLYFVNLALNILWSAFYFNMKDPITALIVLVFLWISIASLIWYNWKINKSASYILIPYLLWVSFAGLLNYLSILNL